ncbi:MAG: DUF819 family protein, partial [Bacteroidota bacterium]
MWYQRNSEWSNWLSPIVLCYLVGILIRNFTAFPIHEESAQMATEISITIAIPLLLFASRLDEVIKYTGTALKSFLLCVAAGLISCLIGTLLFQDVVAEAWKVGGMLVGIYTGGTPNMNAIGIALSANRDYIILLTAADIVTGGIYLVLLTSIIPPLLSRFLPPFNHPDSQQPQGITSAEETQPEILAIFKSSPIPILMSIGILALSAGLSFLLFGNMQSVSFIMLCLTALSILASLLPMVRSWKYTYEIGEYFLLIFCIALGLQADFSDLLANGGQILAFTAFAMLSTIGLHLLLARLFRIDRDTFLITSTAALYGPAFVGQIASVLKNRNVVLAGLAMGLLGYAIGN